MNLELGDCLFTGPAFPEPFVRFELSTHLGRLRMLHDDRTEALEDGWRALRGQLRSGGGPQSVCRHVLTPLAQRLRFDSPNGKRTLRRVKGRRMPDG